MSENYRRLTSTDFSRGSNCGQAVLARFAQHPLLKDAPMTPAVGAGFGGGVGNTGCMCGALAGSVMVAGYYVGTLELEPVAARELSERLTQELVERFKAEYQATCCRVIRRKFCEGTADVHHCNALVEFMVEQTEEVLAHHQEEMAAGGGGVKRWHLFDMLNGAEVALSAVFFLVAFIALGGLFAQYSLMLRALTAWTLFISGLYLAVMRIWRFARYYRK